VRALVHDFSGHPFQVELSRALAGRGHQVLHVHCASYRTGKGAVEPRPSDPPTFSVQALDMGSNWARYSWRRRVAQELAYGRTFSRLAASFAPDVVLSSNDPLFAKAVAARWCCRSGTPWVFWLQDLYSLAMGNFASSRLGPAGKVVASSFRALERRLLKQADGVVLVTPDFAPVLDAWGVERDKRTVIENWAPLDEVRPRPRDNPWARSRGLVGSPVALYSGTLGLKHNPRMLSELARRTAGDGVTVVVVSEGRGAEWLAEERDRLGLTNLRIEPFQPYEALPDVLGTADVLLTLLEPAAGVYSVPSKVLTYLCAGRAVVAALPSENLAARIVQRSEAGVVVDAEDVNGFVAATTALLASEDRRTSAARNGRAFAVKTFDIATITESFEGVLGRAVGSAGRSGGISC
jgi:colanic acid biosynthesis glycosyl transferase WcaI